MDLRKIFLTSIILLCTCGLGAETVSAFDIDKVLQKRSSGNKLVLDYADVLPDIRGYADNYLGSLRDNYGIEALIVTVPSCGDVRSIEDLALEIMEKWRVGAGYNGRGLVLILADDTKKVKLEIGRELEDVFTDAFTGYIEDRQLKNHYLSGDISAGLIAVMEEIEKRAKAKSGDAYDREMILRLDNEFISQGAGAMRDLTGYAAEAISEVGANYPAGATPEEAWLTMIRSYKDKARDHRLGVYTPLTRLAYRDYTNLPDSFYNEEYGKYADKPYEIIEQGDYAVVFFGNKRGWENAPFLLSKTDEGWQFDIVHQRKYIRMGPNPEWMMERADYPHAWHLQKCPWSMGQDIPLDESDRYKVSEDALLAGKITALEEKMSSGTDDIETIAQLSRLYVKTAFNRKAIPLLKKLKQMDPESSLPYKYLAIAYVDAFYQYENAIKELEEYIKREPDDVFGRNYLGYLYLKEKQYDKAIGQLEKAVELNGDNVYAYCKLTRAYGLKYLKAQPLDIFRGEYKKKSLLNYQKAQEADTSDELRIGWLRSWLQGKGILE